jgi:hypothetical protein
MDMDHQNHQAESDDARLDTILQAYRASCPDFEPSAEFMPHLWQKIEARQGMSTVFGRWARNLATAALAFSTLLGLAVSLSGSRVSQLPSESYIEVLAEEHDNASLDFEPVRTMPAAEQR